MNYYVVRAEWVPEKHIKTVCDLIESQFGDVIIMAAGPCDMFDKDALWVLASPDVIHRQVQQIVWEFNNGASVEVSTVDESTAEEYC